MLDRTPSLISFFGAFILSASVAYDFGLFSTLGTSLLEMPTTLSDHLRSSLNWVPLTTISLFVGFVHIRIFNIRNYQGMIKDTSIQKPARLKSKPSVIILINLGISILIPISKLFLDWDIHILIWVYCINTYWICFMWFFVLPKMTEQQISDGTDMLVLTIPAFLILMFGLGINEATKITNGRGTQYVFDVGETKIAGALARSFDKYFLIWDENKKEIMLINTSKVIRFYPQSETDKSNSKNQLQQKKNKNGNIERHQPSAVPEPRKS